MVKAFQNVGYFTFRHFLVMIMLCIIAAVIYTNQTLSLFNSSILIAAFAAFDFAKTKWIKIDTLQKENFKKFASFIWRHLLTVALSFVVLAAISHGTIDAEYAIQCYFFSILIDWIKVKIKFTGNGPYDSHEQMMNASKRLNENSFGRDVATYGTAANHLYNLGYNPGSIRY